MKANFFKLRSNKFKHLLIVVSLFLASFLIYKFIYLNPRNWYDHHLHLAHSLIKAQVDVPALPQFYHDVVRFSGKTYLPFPPGAAITLIPFILLSKNITQQEASVIVGALNVAVMFILLSRFTKIKWAVVLSIFFGFGTVAFWSAVVGTSWYFAQNTALFFLTISLILHFSKKDFWSGLILAMAVLCRYPILFGSLFFILSLIKDKKRLINFLIGFAPVFPIQALYSYLRFGDIFKTGYYEVYEQYTKGAIPPTVLQLIKHNFPVFGYLDIRNILLHLFTFLFMPPMVKLNPFLVFPSPYGMGILFTSPFLFISFKKIFENNKKKLLTFGAASIAIIDFLHYAQGWVQFGYRFVLDFLPFLMILLAINFNPQKIYPKKSIIYFFLFIVSIIVSTWGTLKGIKLGW